MIKKLAQKNNHNNFKKPNRRGNRLRLAMHIGIEWMGKMKTIKRGNRNKYLVSLAVAPCFINTMLGLLVRVS